MKGFLPSGPYRRETPQGSSRSNTAGVIRYAAAQYASRQAAESTPICNLSMKKNGKLLRQLKELVSVAPRDLLQVVCSQFCDALQLDQRGPQVVKRGVGSKSDTVGSQSGDQL